MATSQCRFCRPIPLPCGVVYTPPLADPEAIETIDLTMSEVDDDGPDSDALPDLESDGEESIYTVPATPPFCALSHHSPRYVPRTPPRSPTLHMSK